MIKNFEQFVNEGRFIYEDDKTYQSIINDMRPSDSLTIYLPEDFVIEYERGYRENLKTYKFECNKIELEYWDDDDHRILAYYFHTPGEKGHVCKLYDLTPESFEKVKDYLKTHKYSENELYKNDPRNK